MNKYDYIIIGGGIIGMTTALELSKRGANVAIYERGKLGMEASWAAGGILSSMRPWSENPASAELSEYGKNTYSEYVESLKEKTGIDPEYYRSGLCILNKEHVRHTLEWARFTNTKVSQQFDRHSGIKLPDEAVLLPDIAQIRPNKLIRALHQSLIKYGVSIHQNCEITKLTIKKGRFKSIEFCGQQASAESIIITAGAWSESILKHNIDGICITPIHGEMLCVKGPEPELKTMILDGGHYIIPRQDGHILIGSTMEDIGFDKRLTDDAQEELMNWGSAIFPALYNAEIIKHWSGLRPSTPHGRPYIGRVGDYENIYINAGHFRKGILQAPGSAKLLVDHICGQDSFMDIEKFSVSSVKNTYAKA